MTSLCLTFENSRISLRGAAVSTGVHVATEKTHMDETHCVWTTQITPAEIQTKFTAVEHRVNIKGHKQEEKYGV